MADDYGGSRARNTAHIVMLGNPVASGAKSLCMLR
jgi:hypothetical protein